jgi:hypothetical protein
MKIINQSKLSVKLVALMGAAILLCLLGARTYAAVVSASPLDSWSFSDTNTWTSDLGHAPVSFTNLNTLYFGDGTSLVISNSPAWLQYNLQESDGTTNLTLDQGTISFWYAPSWASTNAGGTGPGVWGRLIEVGTYTNDASLGWWSLYVDDIGENLYFAVLPGDGTTNTSLVAPISWATNYWHCITLTYCATNTALYLDGVLAANGDGITAWPDASVQAGGFYIGSDSTGIYQAQGALVTSLAAGGEEEAAGQLAGLANLKYHYTSAPEGELRNGLRVETHVTDNPNLTAKQAVEQLGVKTPPNKVVPIEDKGNFVPNKPDTVQPHRNGLGGGKDFYNPQRVPSEQVKPAIPVKPEN